MKYLVMTSMGSKFHDIFVRLRVESYLIVRDNYRIPVAISKDIEKKICFGNTNTNSIME